MRARPVPRQVRRSRACRPGPPPAELTQGARINAPRLGTNSARAAGEAQDVTSPASAARSASGFLVQMRDMALAVAGAGGASARYAAPRFSRRVPRESRGERATGPITTLRAWAGAPGSGYPDTAALQHQPSPGRSAPRERRNLALVLQRRLEARCAVGQDQRVARPVRAVGL